MRIQQMFSPNDPGGGSSGNGGEDANVQAPTAEQAAESGAALMAHTVARYRELAASMSDLVPELVRGDTVEEIDASVQAARQTYSEISRRITEQYEARVPVGNPARSSADAAAAALKPEDKIALGLRKF